MEKVCQHALFAQIVLDNYTMIKQSFEREQELLMTVDIRKADNPDPETEQRRRQSVEIRTDDVIVIRPKKMTFEKSENVNVKRKGFESRFEAVEVDDVIVRPKEMAFEKSENVDVKRKGFESRFEVVEVKEAEDDDDDWTNFDAKQFEFDEELGVKKGEQDEEEADPQDSFDPGTKAINLLADLTLY